MSDPDGPEALESRYHGAVALRHRLSPFAALLSAACLEQDPGFKGATDGGSGSATVGTTATAGTATTSGVGSGTGSGSAASGGTSGTGGSAGSGSAGSVSAGSSGGVACRSPDGPPAPDPELAYDYYEDSWTVLPDFTMLTPVDSGTVANFSTSVQLRETDWGAVYRGYLQVPATGTHDFHVASDDGSQLWLGTDLVVDNDGEHGVEEVTGSRCLEAGLHGIEVRFFQGGGGYELTVELTPEGGSRGPIADADLFH